MTANKDRTDPKDPRDDDVVGLSPRLMSKLRIEVEGYDLIETLGEGGQATVYRAVQKADGRAVAIKILHAGPHASRDSRARMKREIAALRAMRHPNIVSAIGAGRTRSGLDCLVMNFIDGVPLDSLWTPSSKTPFPPSALPDAPADRLRLFMQICQTVDAAHRLGITHRDLSPSNILIDRGGVAHILDFGMASTPFDGILTRPVTLTGQFIGKVQYASPEQARSAGTKGSRIDQRTDVYALGVMLYQMLTNGAFPYEVVGDLVDVLNNIISTRPRPPSEVLATPPQRARPVRRNPPLVNETIEAIVLKALEKDPDLRYRSAGELAADIDNYLAGRPTIATPVRTQGARTSARRIAIIASVLVPILLIGVAMNLRTIALWLGLTAAPILPAGSLPIAQASAAQPEGSDRTLNTLATDLARAEARLNAVNRQIASATSRKPPEVEPREQGDAGPLSTPAFLAALAASSKESGREIVFDSILAGDLEREERAEADAIGRETDEGVLLARRAELDAQQSPFWARLAWGVLTGREPDRLFRFRIRPLAIDDANAAWKIRVLDAGVKARRFTAASLDAGASALRNADEPDAVHARIDAQLRPVLSDFLRVTGDARDAGTLSEEEAARVAEIKRLAERLRDGLAGALEMHRRSLNAPDEQARFFARGRLQRDLRDAIDAGVRLDALLATTAREWKIDVDPSSRLPDVRLPGVREERAPTRQDRSESNRPAHSDTTLRAIFPVGATFTGKWMNGYDERVPGKENWENFRNAEVVLSNGRIARLEWTNEWAKWMMEFELVDGTLSMRTLDLIGADFHNFGPTVIRNVSVTGPADQTAAQGTVTLSGTYDWTQTRRNISRTSWPVRFEISRERTPATADSVLPAIGSRLNGTRTWKGQEFNQVFEVVALADNEITLSSPAVTNQHTVFWIVRVEGSKAALVGNYASNQRAVVRINGFSGTYSATQLKFNYADGTITVKLK